MHNGFSSKFGHYGNWRKPGAFFPGPIGWMITLIHRRLIIYLFARFSRLLFNAGNGNTTKRLDALKKQCAEDKTEKEKYRYKGITRAAPIAGNL
jgi:hypothetical protein